MNQGTKEDTFRRKKITRYEFRIIEINLSSNHNILSYLQASEVSHALAYNTGINREITKNLVPVTKVPLAFKSRVFTFIKKSCNKR